MKTSKKEAYKNYKKFAEAVKKTAYELTELEKQAALLNAAIIESGKVFSILRRGKNDRDSSTVHSGD